MNGAANWGYKYKKNLQTNQAFGIFETWKIHIKEKKSLGLINN